MIECLCRKGIQAVYGGEIIALGHGALHVNNLNSVYGIGSPINAVLELNLDM